MLAETETRAYAGPYNCTQSGFAMFKKSSTNGALCSV